MSYGGHGKCAGELRVDQAFSHDRSEFSTYAWGRGQILPTCHLELQTGTLALPDFVTFTLVLLPGFWSRYGPGRTL